MGSAAACFAAAGAPCGSSSVAIATAHMKLRCVHVFSSRCITSAEACAHYALAWPGTIFPPLQCTGSTTKRFHSRKRTHLHLPQDPWFTSLTRDARDFFEERRIPDKVLKDNRIYCVRRPDTNTDYIAFPFYKDGTIVHIKFRAINKKMFFSVSCLGNCLPTAPNQRVRTTPVLRRHGQSSLKVVLTRTGVTLPNATLALHQHSVRTRSGGGLRP